MSPTKKIERIRKQMGDIASRLEKIEPGAMGYSAKQTKEIDRLGNKFEALEIRLRAAEIHEFLLDTGLALTRNTYLHIHAALRLRIEACDENEDYKSARPYRRALKWLDEQWRKAHS